MFQKSFWDIANDVRHLLIGCQVNTDAWFKWLISVSIGDTSNFRCMATKVLFEAGDYLIYRPKVDRWVDFTHCDYGSLRDFTRETCELVFILQESLHIYPLKKAFNFELMDIKIFRTANGHAVNGVHNLLISSSSSSSCSTLASPSHIIPEPEKSVEKQLTIPSTVSEVMRTASERHQKGLMSPHIYQILTSGEIKLPVLLEDENHREFPSIHLIYRPVRQMVYAILFNLHHRMYLATKSKEKGGMCWKLVLKRKYLKKNILSNIYLIDNEKVEVPDVMIKEWVWSATNPYQSPTLVKAEQIGWGVPTIQRLWFG